MDTIIFVLIFLSLWALRGHHRALGVALYFTSLAATLLLFNHHVTSSLKLGF